MEPTTPPTADHPLMVALDSLEAAIAHVAAVAEWTQDGPTAAATTVRLVELESQLASLKLRNLGHVDAVVEAAASSTAGWLAHTTRTSRREADALSRLALALVDDRPVRAALADGAIRVEQAQVIVGAVDDLPTDLDSDLVTKAETYLVEQAGLHDAKALRILGRRLVEVIAPEQADAHESALLEAEERRAAQRTRLTLTDDGAGSTYLRGKIPALHGAMLRKALLAYAAPRHQTSLRGAAPAPRPNPERLGAAFCELLEGLDAKDLPSTGGVGATVVVTMTLETLMGGLRSAQLDTGERLSPGEARRLACEAGIIPAVLGGASVPLDLGRSRRLHSRYHRIALALRDGGCIAEGCNQPPGRTHAHHDKRWSAGGPTNLDNAYLVCSFHHHRIHDPPTRPPVSPTASSASTGGRDSREEVSLPVAATASPRTLARCPIGPASFLRGASFRPGWPSSTTVRSGSADEWTLVAPAPQEGACGSRQYV